MAWRYDCAMEMTSFERLNALIDALSAGLVERRQHVRLALLAALAGEHTLLIGPPGTAKSERARRLRQAIDPGEISNPGKMFPGGEAASLSQHRTNSDATREDYETNPIPWKKLSDAAGAYPGCGCGHGSALAGAHRVADQPDLGHAGQHAALPEDELRMQVANPGLLDMCQVFRAETLAHP